MKKAKFIIAAAVLAGAALFTGCKKDILENSMMPSASHMSEVLGHNDTVTVNRGIVHYHFRTLPQAPDNPFQWSSGHMNAVELFFNGTLVAEPAPMLQTAEAMIHQGIDLGVLADLGIVRPRAGGYRDMSFQVRLFGGETASSLILSGTYNMGGKLVPVKLIVDQSLLLQGKWPGDTKIYLPTEREHVALLELDLAKLTAGIDPEMIRQAMIGSMEVIISIRSNGQLYQAIYQNMIAPDALQVHFE